MAEQSVLGGMMLSKDAIADCVEVLRGLDFYRPAHEAIYEAIIDLYGRGEPADAVTVSDLLTKRGEITRIGGPAYLHTLIQSVPTAANAGFYAEIVRERAVLRRLVDAGTKIVQLGYSQDGEVDAIVNEAQAEVYKVAERRTAEDYVPLRDIIEETVDEIESAGSRGEGMTGVPTGFYELDELTQGLHGGPDDRHRGPTGRRQSPRSRWICQVGSYQEQHDGRLLLPGNGTKRNRHAPAFRRGQASPCRTFARDHQGRAMVQDRHHHGPAQRRPAVHRRFSEHVADGNPCQMSTA